MDIEWVVVADWAWLGFQRHEDKAYIHCRIYSLNVRQFADFGSYFDRLKAYLRFLGFKEMYSLIQVGDTLLAKSDRTVEKFQLRFGMKQIDRFDDKALFKQEL